MTPSRRHPGLLLSALLVAACGGGSSPGSTVDAPGSNPVDGPSGTDPDAPGGTLDGPRTGPDPATDGTATVTVSMVTIPGATGGRTQPGTAYVPSTPGPRPLVVILPGFQLARTQYDSYARHLASWGFAVIAVDYADQSFSPDHAALAADARAILAFAAANQALDVDMTRIGIAGHSLGGKIAVLAASTDTRFKAVVGWDPVDSTTHPAAPEAVSTLTAPLAVIGETTNASGGMGGMPCAPGAENFLQFYAAAPAPSVALTVGGADHMDWVDNPSCFVCSFCTAGTAAPELARGATRRLDVAWFRRQLLGDTAMDASIYSPPESALTVQHK